MYMHAKLLNVYLFTLLLHFFSHSKEIDRDNHFVSQVLAHSETTPMYNEYVDWSGKEIYLRDINMRRISEDFHMYPHEWSICSTC